MTILERLREKAISWVQSASLEQLGNLPEEVLGDNQFAFLVDAKLAVEKSTTRVKVRQSHLKNNGITDPYTDRVRELLESTEETIDGWVTEELVKHPAYPWFSRIKGLGNENIAKVVGLIDITRASYISSLWRYAGMHVINVPIRPERQIAEIEKSLNGLQAKLVKIKNKYSKNPEKERGQIQVLNSVAIDGLQASISVRLEGELVTFIRGYAPTRSMYKAMGTKLDYNTELRTMCFRMAGSMLKAGIRQYCVNCGEQRPPKQKDSENKEVELVCAGCGSKKFESQPISKYAKFYLDSKKKIVEKLNDQGILIVPTLELPTDENNKNKIFEPVGTISASHVHMRAQRKMIKLFLSHLWLVWRQALNLPITKPYTHAILGHAESRIIDPWEMVEKPESKPIRKIA